MVLLRRKTLLWLDDNHDDSKTGNPKIRCSIPGYKGCKEIKRCKDGQILVEPNNVGISLEDQVDVFLFNSTAAILDFLNGEQQRKFTKYPGSLFRIVSNRRLFVGGTGLCKLIDENPVWQFVFPAIMVFHGDNQAGKIVLAGLQELKGRSNITCTSKLDDCMSFVAFGAVMSAASGGDAVTQ
jgi:hypothetical protein